jgi:hypothetical protein
VSGGAEEHSLLLSELMSDLSLIVVKSVIDMHLVGTVLEALAGGMLQQLPVVILLPNLCVKMHSLSIFMIQGVLVMPMWSTRDIASLKDSWHPLEPDATGAEASTVHTLTPEGPIVAMVVVVGAGSDASIAKLLCCCFCCYLLLPP